MAIEARRREDEEIEIEIEGLDDENEWEKIERTDRIVWDVPKTIQGTYLSGEAGRGVNKLHTMDIAGERPQFFGTTLLDPLLARFEPGDWAKIRYLGEQKLSGGKTLKKFEVFRRRKSEGKK